MISVFNKVCSLASAEKNIMIEGMQEIMRQTCVIFVHRSSETDYVEIINDEGCWSYLGRIGGRQELSLQRNGCVYKGTAMHELIHALG
jgi:Astacin (Peptidase family M12A)